MTFFLGTHRPHWLGLVRIRWCVSRHSLHQRRTFPRALLPWMLDSGGFSELDRRHTWTVPPRQYVAEVRRFAAEVGQLQVAAIQDWMCEPGIREKTGLSTAEHQRRTVTSYLTLKDLAPELPWLPVLQGWETDDYRRCWDDYEAAGVDLAALPLVGLGSVCRRQHTLPALAILQALTPLKLHALGFKREGLRQGAALITTADSFAWSFRARRSPPLPGCVGHINCANCLRYALIWRQETLEPFQCQLPLPFAA